MRTLLLILRRSTPDRITGFVLFPVCLPRECCGQRAVAPCAGRARVIVAAMIRFATVLRARVAHFSRVGSVRHIARGLAGGSILQVANKLLALTSSVILARLLGVEGFGLFAFAVAAGGFASVAVEIGQGPLILRETARGDASRSPQAGGGHIAQSLLLLCVAGCGAAVITFAALAVSGLGLSHQERLALGIALPIAVLTAMIRVLAAALVGLKRLLAGQAVEQLLAPVTVVAGALILSAGSLNSPFLALAVQCASLALAVVGGMIALKREVRIGARNGPSLKTLASRGLPFLLIGSALVIYQQIDTLIIGFALGTEAVGPYRIASQLAMTAIFPTILVNTVISPYVVQLVHDGNMTGFRKLFYGATALNIAGTGAAFLVFALFGSPIVTLLYGPDYGPAVPLMLILTVGYLVNCLFGPTGTVLSMTGHERLAAKVLGVMAAANAALCIVLAPKYGAIGVATITASTIAGYQVVMRIAQRRLLGI